METCARSAQPIQRTIFFYPDHFPWLYSHFLLHINININARSPYPRALQIQKCAQPVEKQTRGVTIKLTQAISHTHSPPILQSLSHTHTHTYSLYLSNFLSLSFRSLFSFLLFSMAFPKRHSLSTFKQILLQSNRLHEEKRHMSVIPPLLSAQVILPTMQSVCKDTKRNRKNIQKHNENKRKEEHHPFLNDLFLVPQTLLHMECPAERKVMKNCPVSLIIVIHGQ